MIVHFTLKKSTNTWKNIDKRMKKIFAQVVLNPLLHDTSKTRNSNFGFLYPSLVSAPPRRPDIYSIYTIKVLMVLKPFFADLFPSSEG